MALMSLVLRVATSSVRSGCWVGIELERPSSPAESETRLRGSGKVLISSLPPRMGAERDALSEATGSCDVDDDLGNGPVLGGPGEGGDDAEVVWATEERERR